MYWFNKATTTNILRPESLPPTEGAAEQHILRAHLQYNDWVLLNSKTLLQTEYGWRITDDGIYKPIRTTCEIGPSELMKQLYATALASHSVYA